LRGRQLISARESGPNKTVGVTAFVAWF